MFSAHTSKKISILFSGILLCLFFLSFVPLVASAQGTGIVYVCNRGAPGECRFEDLVIAARNVVNFGTQFALAFSVVVLAYAGFKYMTSEGNPGKISAATHMLTNVCIGIFFVLTAWLIVTLILNALGVNSVVQLG